LNFIAPTFFKRAQNLHFGLNRVISAPCASPKSMDPAAVKARVSKMAIAFTGAFFR
jgi:hypothetical protein